MGDPSYFLYANEAAHTTVIDWDKIPEKSKTWFFERYGYDWETKKQKDIPKTVAEFAVYVNESKFFGYIGPELGQLFVEIGTLGIAAPSGKGWQRPRFYMKYTQNPWFLQFDPTCPSEGGGCIGYGSDLPGWSETEDLEEEVVQANERSVAEEHCGKFQKEDNRYDMETLLATASKFLNGWHAFSIKESLEQGQLMKTMMSLPLGHPAMDAYFKATMDNARAPYK